MKCLRFVGVFIFYTIHFCGHFSWHLPQAVQSSALICARLSLTEIAPNSHCFWQSLQPMQAAAQTFFAAAPLSLLEQATCFALLLGIILIILLGQTLSHLRQPTQSSSKTFAVPFITDIAPLSQTLTQSPRPIQPKLQADGPP